MPRIEFVVPHATEATVARDRIDRYIREKSGEQADRLAEAHWEWSGTALTFQGGAGGYQVSGRLDVTSSEVYVSAEVPAMVLFFRAQIIDKVTRELQRVLAGD